MDTSSHEKAFDVCTDTILIIKEEMRYDEIAISSGKIVHRKDKMLAHKLRIAAAWKVWMDYCDEHAPSVPRSFLVPGENPKGIKASVPGLDLQTSILTRKVPVATNTSMFGVLQAFIIQDYPISYIQWLLRAGFYPNLYDGRVTAMGVAAYTGKHEILDLLRRWGGDVDLKLKAEHAEGNKDFSNSTLLFRVMGRQIQMDKKIATVRLLAKYTTIPIEPTESGKTVLDFPANECVAAIRDELAQRERAELAKTTMGGGWRNPSLRM